MSAEATPSLTWHVPGRAPLRVALSTPALRRCQLTAATARLVDMASLVVVSVHLFSRGGPESVASFVAVRTLAPAIGTPLIMAAVGRRCPGRALTVCASAAGAATAVTAMLVATVGATWAIIGLAGVSGVALYCLRPLVMALLPSHINGPTQLLATNSMAAFVDNASTLAGPLLAGATLATVGPAAALWASAVLLGITAAFVRSLRGSPRLDPSQDEQATGAGRAAVEGLAVLFRSGPLRLVTALSAGQTFVRGALSVLVVALAIESLDMGEGGVGVLFGAIGVGGLLGLPVAVRVAHAGHMARALGLALVLWGAPIAAVAYAPGPVLAIALFAVIGLGNDLVDITSDTLLQRLVPSGALPCTLGAFDAVLYAAMGLGAVTAERLANGLGLRAGLVVVGLFLPVLAVVAWRSLHSLDHRVRTQDADVGLLQIHGIFSPLVMSTVDYLAQRMQRESFAMGEVILRKGDDGDRFLMIEDGHVEVVDGGELLAVLGPGEGFGEMALLDDAPRNATVVARTPVQVRSLRRDDFLAALRSQDAAGEAARLMAARRRRSTETVEDVGGDLLDVAVVSGEAVGPVGGAGGHDRAATG